jgi:hypothetical protein
MKRKNNYLIILFVCLLAVACNTSQKEQAKDESDKNQETSLKTTSPRYQIVQSSLAARGTYKLDTYEGKVYQLVLDGSNNETWQLLKRIGNNSNDNQINGQQNYQIFLSTLAMKFTYLINVNTGATWQLVQDPNTEENFFSAIKE